MQTRADFIEVQRGGPRVKFRTAQSTFFLAAGSVLWIESRRANCLVHTLARNYLACETIDALAFRLAALGFCRCSRSLIVNTAHVYAINERRGERMTLTLSDGSEHPLSADRKSALECYLLRL